MIFFFFVYILNFIRHFLLCRLYFWKDVKKLVP